MSASIGRSILLGLAGMFAATDVVEAQQAARSPVSLGVMAGWSTPNGAQAGQLYGRGGQIGVLGEVRMPLSWLAVRVDAGYQSLGGRTAIVTDANGVAVGQMQRSDAMYSAAASVVLRWPGLRTAVQPYALAGGGSYWVRSSAVLPSLLSQSAPQSASMTMRTTGFTAGAGVETPVRRAILFGEVRYQQFGQAPMRFVPVNVGLRLK